MKNLATHIETVVRDELAAKARALGIPKEDVGFALGGYGSVGVLVTKNGQAGFGPTWSLLVTLRSKLIGYGPVGIAQPVSGVLPGDDDFRLVASALLESVNADREAQFNGAAV